MTLVLSLLAHVVALAWFQDAGASFPDVPGEMRQRALDFVRAGDTIRSAGVVGRSWFVRTDHNYFSRGVPDVLYKALPLADRVALGTGGAWVALLGGNVRSGGPVPPQMTATLNRLAKAKIPVASIALMGPRWMVVSGEGHLDHGGFPIDEAAGLNGFILGRHIDFAALDASGKYVVLADGNVPFGPLPSLDSKRRIKSQPGGSKSKIVFLSAGTRDVILQIAAPEEGGAPVAPLAKPLDPMVVELTDKFIETLRKEGEKWIDVGDGKRRQKFTLKRTGVQMTIRVYIEGKEPPRTQSDYTYVFDIDRLRKAEFVVDPKGKVGRFSLYGEPGSMLENVQSDGRPATNTKVDQIGFTLKDLKGGKDAVEEIRRLVETLKSP